MDRHSSHKEMHRIAQILATIGHLAPKLFIYMKSPDAKASKCLVFVCLYVCLFYLFIEHN